MVVVQLYFNNGFDLFLVVKLKGLLMYFLNRIFKSVIVLILFILSAANAFQWQGLYLTCGDIWLCYKNVHLKIF